MAAMTASALSARRKRPSRRTFPVFRLCLPCTFYMLRAGFGGANVNHLIRGEESERDSLFVKKICMAADVELFYREYDIPSLAKKLKLGEEECGRKMRYEFFDELSESWEEQRLQRHIT